MVRDILSLRLSDLDEAAIKALADGKIAESLRLEYKAQLNLSGKDERKQRNEAAKDVSAMANTAGGRLLYGVSEVELEDGSAVAGPMTPLTDGSVIDTLANVLATTIEPRPLFAMQRVDVSGGFVLVVEVHPSSTDIHMVTGYGDGRFYRRLPGRALPMSAHEVRQAYARVLKTKAELATREDELLSPEDKRRSHTSESIFVVPIDFTGSLVNPGDVEALRTDVQAVLGRERDFGSHLAYSLRTEADGCRAQLTDTDYVYLAILKTGVVHYSHDGALFRVNDGQNPNLHTPGVVARILQTLELSRRIYDRIGYHHSVRVRYVLRPSAPFFVDLHPRAWVRGAAPGPAEVQSTGPVEAYLSERQHSRTIKELVDPIFHAVHTPKAPWFDDSGAFTPEFLKLLPPHVAGLLG